jgi:hypothetical protein
LKETGFIDVQNVKFDYRSAEVEWTGCRASRWISSIAESRSSQPSVAMSRRWLQRPPPQPIPIVFLKGSDPIRSGLVASTNRAGGNITGVGEIAVVKVTYQRRGRGCLPARAALLSDIIDPRGWLEQRLGPLACLSKIEPLERPKSVVHFSSNRER